MENRGIITPANMQTIVVVGFIIALLAFVLAVFNSYKMSAAANVATDWLEHYSAASADTQAELSSMRAKVSSLEKELSETKKILAQPIVVDVPVVEPAVDTE